MSLYTVLMALHVMGYILTFADLVFASLQKPSKIQTDLMLMCIAILFMSSGYFFELKSTSLDMAFGGTYISYLGKPFVLMFFFMFICDFYRFRLSRVARLLLYLLGSVETVMALTTRTTRLFYSDWVFDISNRYAPIVYENGPFYIFHILMMLFYFTSCIVLIIRGYRKTRNRVEAPYAIGFVLMILCGMIGYVAYITGLSRGYDTTLYGTVGGMLCLSVLFYKYRILGAISIAKEAALEHAATGLVVVDRQGTLAYANIEGERLLKNVLSLPMFSEMKEENRYVHHGDQVYKITKEKIFDEGKHLCTSFEIRDVTDTMNYQKRLETDVAERTDQIRAIQRQITGSLANVVEARSLETGEHIKRTSECVAEIAAAYRRKNGDSEGVLSDKDIDLMVSAAPLHDVGKISVPDNILLKPGKLTAEEFEVIKTHTTNGADVIEKVMRGVESDEYVDLAKEIALFHHERWDGTGYPQGLKEDRIPLAARIMAVADVYDALTAERCYKKAMSKEKAIGIIREETGTHFDPEVVDAFLATQYGTVEQSVEQSSTSC